MMMTNTLKKFKQAAIGIALATPAIALVLYGLQKFNEDKSYQCRYFTPAECKHAQEQDAENRKRMLEADEARAKETKKENDKKLANFRPHGWN